MEQETMVGLEIEFSRCGIVNDFLKLDWAVPKKSVFVIEDCIPAAYVPKRPWCYDLPSWVERMNKNLFFECLRLDVFPAHDTQIFIDSYNQFLHSDCIVSVILYDMLHLEIYSKTQLEELRRKAESLNARIDAVIMNSNVERTHFTF